MNFIKSLLTDSEGSLSSKRFIAIILTFTLIIIALANTFFQLNTAEFIVITIASLILSCLGLNTLISTKSISSKQEVASDLAKNNTEDPSASKAKEIIEN